MCQYLSPEQRRISAIGSCLPARFAVKRLPVLLGLPVGQLMFLRSIDIDGRRTLWNAGNYFGETPSHYTSAIGQRVVQQYPLSRRKQHFGNVKALQAAF